MSPITNVLLFIEITKLHCFKVVENRRKIMLLLIMHTNKAQLFTARFNSAFTIFLILLTVITRTNSSRRFLTKNFAFLVDFFLTKFWMRTTLIAEKRCLNCNNSKAEFCHTFSFTDIKCPCFALFGNKRFASREYWMKRKRKLCHFPSFGRLGCQRFWTSGVLWWHNICMFGLKMPIKVKETWP